MKCAIAGLLCLAACVPSPVDAGAELRVGEAQTKKYPIEREGDETERLITLEEIPAMIREIAVQAVPGLVIQDGEKEFEHGRLIYCVHGTLGGHSYEVEVAEDGEVIEIETGDEVDGDDGDDDDGDDDGDDDDEH